MSSNFNLVGIAPAFEYERIGEEVRRYPRTLQVPEAIFDLLLSSLDYQQILKVGSDLGLGVEALDSLKASMLVRNDFA
jgi:hypothetical protein